MNTIIESDAYGRFIRVGGTKSMDDTFAGLWITRPPEPAYVQNDAGEVEVLWSPDASVELTRFMAAIENERILRAPHAEFAPRGGETWEEYVARLKTEHRAEPPAVFALPRIIAPPEKMPMSWVHCDLAAADGTLIYAWAPDIMEGKRRQEREEDRLAAEADVALIRRHPVAIRRFRRALRRLEHRLARVAPRLKGIIFDVQEARRHLGTCRGRHSRVGIDKAAKWFAAVANADRVSTKRMPRPYRRRDLTRIAAYAFELVAQQIQKLAMVKEDS